MKKISTCFQFLLITTALLITCSFVNYKNIEQKPPASPGWKIGIALYSFNKHPFTTAIAMADSAGLKNVEGFSFYNLGEPFTGKTMGSLDDKGVSAMKKMLAEKGIKMNSMFVGGADDAAGWKKYFELCKQFGVQYIVTEPAKKDWDLLDSLAGVFNIKIAIHEHAKAHSAYWHPDSVLAAIKGHKNIGACADLGHWARSGLDVVKCLQMLQGHIYELHVKDIDQLGNDNANDVNPGKGVIDYPAVFKELKRQHFKGVMNIECEHNMDNNLKDVKETVNYLTELAKNE